MLKVTVTLILVLINTMGTFSQAEKKIDAVSGATSGGDYPDSEKKSVLQVVQKDTVIQILRQKTKAVLMTHVSKPDNRPYIHPIMSPEGKGIFTEYRPSHHRHQTGLYWGLKRVNERDFFMGWNENFYRKVSASIIKARGQEVKWQSVYDLLDENKNVVLTETHNWTLTDYGDRYYLDLEYSGEARTDITFGQYYVGGLFIRMPWVKGIPGQVVNAMGQRNSKEAEAQRAIWADVSIQIEGMDKMGHVAMFDHPYNSNFPTAWRVDSQLGIGPSKQITGDWKLDKGKTEVFRYRILIYTGELEQNPDFLKQEWIRYVKEE